jgi:sugar/nucleoside kinase (ribokinase family)
MGDLLVEVMRKELDQPLSRPADFAGPFPSGASAIFIDAAARLGGSTGYIGVAGQDDFAECVVGRLRTDGVDTSHVRYAPGYTTGTAFVAYRSDGSRKFVYHLSQSAAAQLKPEDVDANYVQAAAFVHITGSALSMNESVRQACYKAVKVIKEAGARVSFDPNIRPELLGIERVREIVGPVMEACDLLLPNCGAQARRTRLDRLHDESENRGPFVIGHRGRSDRGRRLLWRSLRRRPAGRLGTGTRCALR